jgi:two-component system, cell cycle response regulator
MTIGANFTILLVDDSAFNLKVLADAVEGSGYKPVLASNGQQAFECIRVEKPDLILLDVIMPQVDGFQVCSQLKKDPEFRDIPIIFLTARAETNDIVKGFEVGGVDYITKPFNVVELRARINTHLQAKIAHDEIKQFNDQLKKTIKKLHEANEMIKMKNLELEEFNKKLDFVSRTDPLTGLYNRRHIMEKIQEEAVRFKRNKKSFSLLIADVDFFKSINDTYGHAFGDYVLKTISKNMRETAREQDTVARWGGEEFLLLLPETEAEGASILAERMRKKIAEIPFQCDAVKLTITMTFGVAAMHEHGAVDDVIKRADNALYDGKKKGKNRVMPI